MDYGRGVDDKRLSDRGVTPINSCERSEDGQKSSDLSICLQTLPFVCLIVLF